MSVLSSFRSGYVEVEVAKNLICQKTNILEDVDVPVTRRDKLHPTP